ncbi:MAG: hypothetical protein ACKOCF_11015 [Gammaproteobacteria bacterium]
MAIIFFFGVVLGLAYGIGAGTIKSDAVSKAEHHPKEKNDRHDARQQG